MFLVKKAYFIVILVITLLTSSVMITYALIQTRTDEVTVNSIAPIDATLTSNRYTQVDDLREVNDNPYTSLEDHEKMGETTKDGFSLYVHPSQLSLRILDENTGYIWSSNMTYDYRYPEHPLYDETDIGALNYQIEGYDINRDRFVRQDRSPVVITYYNTLNPLNTRVTEYFFEATVSGQSVIRPLNNQNGFRASLTMPQSKIKFDLIVYLDEEGLNVEIPFDSIVDNNNFVISTISVYRYLGFTKDDYTPGYVFIPDGVGALMRYGDKNTEQYAKKFYGVDFTNEPLNAEKNLTASVYGLVHGVNQQAMLGIINQGAGNAIFSYVPANNLSTDFNRAQLTFEYRSTYIQKLNASGTSTIERIQQNKNPFDVHLTYKFLRDEKANYVGFANEYRSYLTRKGMEFNKLNQKDNIPMHLDVLGAENKKVWYGSKVFTMTTADQLIDIINDLNVEGINQLDITLHGWQKGGASHTAPKYNKVESKIGDITALNSLDNINVFYAVSPFTASVKSKGYSSSQVVQTSGSDLVTIDDNYLLDLNEALQILSKNYSEISKKGISNLALSEYTTLLYSNYKDGILSRSQSIELVKKFLEIAQRTLVDQPYDYLFSSDVISNIELYSSQQLKFTDTVPFLPVLLSGYKDVYGRNHNFFANTSNELLRMIDYHVFPNFYVTHESAGLLLNTGSSHIFTSRYSDWKSEILRQYNYVNDALKHVYHASYVSREVLAPGIIKNVYNNDVVIYINYSGEDYQLPNVTIKSLSYEVIQ